MSTGSTGGATGSWAKVTAKTALEVCKKVPLAEPAKKLLKETQTPRQYLDLLVQNQLFLDAVKFLAFALPKREAVWWACVCARVPGTKPLLPAHQQVLQATEKWVSDSSDESRRAAYTAAEGAKFDNPASTAALAAFFSAGSIVPANLPAVAPADDVAPQAVCGSISLAAVSDEPTKIAERYKKFVSLGCDVANGTNKWK